MTRIGTTRILIICPDTLQGCIHVFPLIQSIRKTYPDASLCLACDPVHAFVFRNHPYLPSLEEDWLINKKNPGGVATLKAYSQYP